MLCSCSAHPCFFSFFLFSECHPLQVSIRRRLLSRTSAATRFGPAFYPTPGRPHSRPPALPSNRASPTPFPFPPPGRVAYGVEPSAPRTPPGSSLASPETAAPPPWNAPEEMRRRRPPWRSSPWTVRAGSTSTTWAWSTATTCRWRWWPRAAPEGTARPPVASWTWTPPVLRSSRWWTATRESLARARARRLRTRSTAAAGPTPPQTHASPAPTLSSSRTRARAPTATRTTTVPAPSPALLLITSSLSATPFLQGN